jgi:hypothetical protein
MQAVGMVNDHLADCFRSPGTTPSNTGFRPVPMTRK